MVDSTEGVLAKSIPESCTTIQLGEHGGRIRRKGVQLASELCQVK